MSCITQQLLCSANSTESSTGSSTAVTVTELVLLQQLDCQIILLRHWAIGTAMTIKDTFALRQKFFAELLLRFHGYSKLLVKTKQTGWNLGIIATNTTQPLHDWIQQALVEYLAQCGMQSCTRSCLAPL